MNKHTVTLEKVLCPTCNKTTLVQTQQQAKCPSCERKYNVLGKRTVSFI